MQFNCCIPAPLADAADVTPDHTPAVCVPMVTCPSASHLVSAKSVHCADLAGVKESFT